MIQSLVAASFIVLVSFVGLIFSSVFARNFISKNLSYLVSLAAGVFLFTAINLMMEASEVASIEFVLAGLASGFLFFFFLDRFIPESHHHHGDGCGHGHSKKGATKMLIGDAIHNMADGLILVPAFLVSTTVGIITTVSILIHEALQEVSEYFVLIDSGYSNRRAVIRNFLVSLTIFLGVFLGAFLSSTSLLQALVLSFSAGAFLHIVSHDLIPKSILRKGGRDVVVHGLFFIAGFFLLYVVSMFLPHAL